ncbi:hypothetical protein CR513_54800, partial [Mucuna pruriens]
MSPYWIIFDKACHLPIEIEHRAYWAVKQCNLAYDQAGRQRKFQLQELNELRLEALQLKDEHTNSTFQVNGLQIKLFHEGPTPIVGELETISLMESAPSQQAKSRKPCPTSTLGARGVLELFWEWVSFMCVGDTEDIARVVYLKRVEKGNKEKLQDENKEKESS